MADLSRDDSTSVGTPAQPQLHAMGAARRDPRRGESPVARGQARFPFLPSPGEVVSEYRQYVQSNFRRVPPCCIKMDTTGRLFKENSMNANVNYCGVIILLRQLVTAGHCTKKEANRIAARIAKKTGADMILSI